MEKVEAFSHYLFDKMCENKKINDFNVGCIQDKAFISIVGTKDVQEYYLEEKEYHWFKHKHSNVLNLEFDDVDEDKEWDGHVAMAITDEQAEEIVNFIEENLGKNFLIHCRAGMSRSQAIKHFIVSNYEEYKDVPLDTCSTPNVCVLRKLNAVLWNRKFNQ